MHKNAFLNRDMLWFNHYFIKTVFQSRKSSTI